MTALSFMSGFSAAARLSASEPEAIAAQPPSIVVERWNGSEWVEARLAWNGESYILEVA